jgi:arylsulfatase A-like enzyme
MVGRLIDALDASGKADQTIIVLIGDHGFHLGEKHRWRKQTLWEEATRVPLIVVAPGVTTPGARTDAPVSLMDIYPTLTELSGIGTPAHIEGTSLVPLLEDPDAEWSHVAITTNTFEDHAVRDQRYRYIRHPDGTEELYDHETDPNEWTNVANDPAMEEIRLRLARNLPSVNTPQPLPVGGRGRGRGALE